MRSDDVTARRSHHADVDSMLKAIKDGRITTGDHDREVCILLYNRQLGEHSDKQPIIIRESSFIILQKAEERIKKHIEIVAEADRRLSVLNSEKDKV